MAICLKKNAQVEKIVNFFKKGVRWFMRLPMMNKTNCISSPEKNAVVASTRKAVVLL